MMREPIHPKEYKYRVQFDSIMLTHENDNCDHPILGEVFSLDQTLIITEEHEKRWHRAKVIQLPSEHTGRTGPQRFTPL